MSEKVETMDKPLGKAEKWEYATTKIYSGEMVDWCSKQGLEYEKDYDIHTYRLQGHSMNSHHWSFNNGKYATALILARSGSVK